WDHHPWASTFSLLPPAASWRALSGGPEWLCHGYNMNPLMHKCSSGVPGLDDILGGGFPRNCFYLVEGSPGVGKTTLAMQFLLEGKRAGESCLYVTLSETKQELQAVALSHHWDLDG